MKARAAKQLVRATFAEIIPHTGLSWWNITIAYNHRSKPHHGPNVRVPMRCSTDWRYREAFITVYLQHVKTMTDKQIVSLCWHEAMHIFLNQLGNRQGSDAEEATASNLARAFGWWTDHLKAGA